MIFYQLFIKFEPYLKATNRSRRDDKFNSVCQPKNRNWICQIFGSLFSVGSICGLQIMFKFNEKLKTPLTPWQYWYFFYQLFIILNPIWRPPIDPAEMSEPTIWQIQFCMSTKTELSSRNQTKSNSQKTNHQSILPTWNLKLNMISSLQPHWTVNGKLR